MSNTTTTKAVRMPEPCPGCSATHGVPHASHPRVYMCKGCSGVIGHCYLGESYNLVAPWFVKAEPPAERVRYFDLTCLGSQGITRRHGWFDVETRLIVQVG